MTGWLIYLAVQLIKAQVYHAVFIILVHLLDTSIMSDTHPFDPLVPQEITKVSQVVLIKQKLNVVSTIL